MFPVLIFPFCLFLASHFSDLFSLVVSYFGCFFFKPTFFFVRSSPEIGSSLSIRCPRDNVIGRFPTLFPPLFDGKPPPHWWLTGLPRKGTWCLVLIALSQRVVFVYRRYSSPG